ncbi:MAG TPA: DUF6624 domain-containing protein [Allosphingosinicella sp.]|jgi:hypothetical protein
MQLMLLALLGGIAVADAAPADAQTASGRCVTEVAAPGMAVSHCSPPPPVAVKGRSIPANSVMAPEPSFVDRTPQARTPPPPAALQPYVRAGALSPGDYAWIRGRFPSASGEEKAAAASVQSWLDACREAEVAETRASLAAVGIATPSLEEMPFRDRLCGQVAGVHAGAANFPSFETFQQAMRAAEPVAWTYLNAVRVAEGVARRQAETVRDELLARMVGEQAFRFAISWGHGDLAAGPQLSETAVTTLRAQVRAAAAERDRDNTKWLKSVVEKNGWPTISSVGKNASQAAWLMLQYAGSDPGFQVRALKLMQPLVARDEVQRQHYAYAYDGVMLTLTGKQRFGTDTSCRAGRWIVKPLEDESKVEAYRKAVGLPPLSEYLGQLQAAGQCRAR